MQPTVAFFPLGGHPHATPGVSAALACTFADPRRDSEHVFFGDVGDGARALRVLREDHVVSGVALHVDDGDLVAVGSGHVGEVLELLQLRVGRVEEHVTALLEARPQGGLEDTGDRFLRDATDRPAGNAVPVGDGHGEHVADPVEGDDLAAGLVEAEEGALAYTGRSSDDEEYPHGVPLWMIVPIGAECR